MILVIVILAALVAALLLAAPRSHAARQASSRLAGGARFVVLGSYRAAIAAALVLALVQVTVVILVSVFSVSAIWLQESTSYLFAGLFLLGAGGAYLTDAHVRVDVLSSRWPPRRRARVELLGVALFLLPVCALIVAASVPWAAASWMRLERSGEPSGLHLVFVLKTLVPLFGVLLALSGVVRGADAARRLADD